MDRIVMAPKSRGSHGDRSIKDLRLGLNRLQAEHPYVINATRWSSNGRAIIAPNPTLDTAAKQKPRGGAVRRSTRKHHTGDWISTLIGNLRILADNELNGKNFTVNLGAIDVVHAEPRHGGGVKKPTMNSARRGCARC
jgi:hypothetical protein